jgi:hypothetical protein
VNLEEEQLAASSARTQDVVVARTLGDYFGTDVDTDEERCAHSAGPRPQHHVDIYRHDRGAMGIFTRTGGTIGMFGALKDEGSWRGEGWRGSRMRE